MADIGKIFQWRTVSGEPWTIGDTMIVPEARSLLIQTPFGGFVWNRPVAIVVEKAGRSERIAILDLTRLIMMLLPTVGVGLTLVARLYDRSRQAKG